MPTRFVPLCQHFANIIIQGRYILTGVLLVGSILFCCIATQVGPQLPEKSVGIRDIDSKKVADHRSALEHRERTEPAEQEVRTDPGRAETASGHAHRIAVALRSGTIADKEMVFTTLLPELLQHDFSLAVGMVERLESWAWREEAVKYIVREWAALNPAEAANWASRLPHPSDRKIAIQQLCLSVAQTEPAHAMTIAERFGGGNWNGVLLEQLVSLWAAKDCNAAANWVTRQPQGELRNKAFARLAMLRAEVSPAEAVELVVDRIAPGQVQTEAAMSILHQWILRDPSGASSWVKLFPDGDLRRRAEEELAGAVRYRQPES